MPTKMASYIKYLFLAGLDSASYSTAIGFIYLNLERPSAILVILTYFSLCTNIIWHDMEVGTYICSSLNASKCNSLQNLLYDKFI
jgi:hypothetical protein